jgi:cysteine desulfurase / selenocysteine lyase
MSSLEIEKIRSDFPILEREVNGKDLIYFDNAASTLKPRSVINAINHHYSLETANIHRGVHYLSELGTRKYEETRDKIKEFIKAKDSCEIIFTKGTTDSLNLVAHSFGLKFFEPGDEIILSTLEHHSNIVPWQLIAEKTGAKIIETPINDKGEIILEEFKKKLGPKTKMVSTSYISNTLGTINPIKEMISLAHAVGAKFTVDAAQAIAHLPIDVIDLDCDFLAFSSHKIYGPTGVGVLYGKKALLEEMPPYQGGGDMIDRVTIQKTTYNDLPHKFEAGTPHIAGVIALKDAIEYVEEIGLNEISEYENDLLEFATKKMEEIKGLKIIGTSKNKAAVISFVIEDGHPHDVGILLDKQGIAVRTGHHCTQPLMDHFGIPGTIRASFSFYNTKEEIEVFITGLKKTMEFL